MLPFVFALLLLLPTSPAFAALKKFDTAPAIAAADAWLKLLDSKQYVRAWNEGSELFRSKVTQEMWSDAIEKARELVGKLESRKLNSERFTTSLPDGPKGKYVVIQFHSYFEKKPDSTETITPMLEKDGKWRVTGYFIK